MWICISFTNIQHFLESNFGWSKKKVVIGITPDSTVRAVDPTAKATSSKFLKQVITVKTVKDSTTNGTLANPIADVKDFTKDAIPSDVGKWVNINEEKDADEDGR